MSTLGAIGSLALVVSDYTPEFHHKPYHVAVVNIVVDELSDDLESLHYFFCYEQEFKIHRVTIYNHFCSQMAEDKGTYLSVELLLNDQEKEQLDVKGKCLDDLKKMKVIAEDTKILFSQLELLPYGFPLPSAANMNAFFEAGERLRKTNNENLIVGGVLSEPDLFFQAEVIADVCKKIKNSLDQR